MKHFKWVSVVLVLIAFGIGWEMNNLEVAFKFLSITGIPASFAYFGGYGDGRDQD